MNYTFQFGAVFEAFGELLEGTWLTIQLSAAAMLIGLVVAILCALGKTAGPRPVRWLIDAYIEVIRNTPFLVQIFLIFFGLPALGLRLLGERGRAARHGGQRRRLRDRDHPRRHRDRSARARSKPGRRWA